MLSALNPAIAGGYRLGMLRVRMTRIVIWDSSPYCCEIVVSPSRNANMEEILTVVLVIADPRGTVVPLARQNGLSVERECNTKRADV
jgi:hypothetical protein